MKLIKYFFLAIAIAGTMIEIAWIWKAGHGFPVSSEGNTEFMVTTLTLWVAVAVCHYLGAPR